MGWQYWLPFVLIVFGALSSIKSLVAQNQVGIDARVRGNVWGGLAIVGVLLGGGLSLFGPVDFILSLDLHPGDQHPQIAAKVLILVFDLLVFVASMILSLRWQKD